MIHNISAIIVSAKSPVKTEKPSFFFVNRQIFSDVFAFLFVTIFRTAFLQKKRLIFLVVLTKKRRRASLEI